MQGTPSPPQPVCPSSFPVTLSQAQPYANRPFTLTLTGPSQSFGLQTLVGPGVQSVQSPTTNPGTLTAQIQAPPDVGTYNYQYYINGQVCQTISVQVVPLLG